MESQWSNVMAARNAKREAADSLSQEIQATRVIWNDGVDSTNASLQELIAQLSRFAKDLYDSPLGKRAQRHPVAAIGVASLALLVARKLLRR